MKDKTKKVGNGLSIKELEAIMLLTVAPTYDIEVSKRCTSGGEVDLSNDLP